MSLDTPKDGLPSSRVHHRERGDIPGCIPAPRDQMLLDSQGIGPDSVADQYCKAIRKFLKGKLSEREMLHIMGAKKVL